MFRLAIAALLSSLLTTASASEPRTLYVAAPTCQVWSGPGDAYYPTGTLHQGEPLEVHRELSGGWLAVRPMQGSFSLVSAADVESAGEGLGRITRKSVRSRVGSELGDRHDAVHVQLEAGETVSILGTWPHDPSWLMIAPPAGEFRYVRAEDVSQTATPAAAGGAWRERAPVVDPAVQTVADEQPVASRYQLTPETSVEALAPPPLEVPALAAEVPPVASAPIAAPTATTAMAPSSQNQGLTPPDRPAPSAGPTSTAPVANSTKSPTAAAIDQLEISLALRVSQPINVWQFADLENQAASLSASSLSAEEQSVLRDIAERIDRFSRLQQRYMAARGDLALNQPAASDVTPIADDPAHTADTAVGDYDAIGVLRPVVSKRAGAPPYALVDPQGRIVTFVTPSPSLNMQPLLGQRVGISGTRGFMPEYQQRHVATARIEAVEGTQRR